METNSHIFVFFFTLQFGQLQKLHVRFSYFDLYGNPEKSDRQTIYQSLIVSCASDIKCWKKWSAYE